MNVNLTISSIIRQRTPSTFRQIQMILITFRTSICNLRSHDVAFATDALVAGWTSVGHDDYTVAEVAFSVRVPPVVAERNDVAFVGVGVSARAGSTSLVVDGCYTVVAGYRNLSTYH